MNHKKVLIIVAAQAALPIANKINREIHAYRNLKARERVRAAWKAGDKDAIYTQPMSSFEKYLNDLGSLYEAPTGSRQRYEDNAEFNKIIRRNF